MEVKFDLSDFEDWARRLGGAQDQVPFAAAGALNDALFETRQGLIDETWPHSVNVRNATFLSWAFRVEKADKHKLEGAIYDSTPDHRAHLALHADGGTKVPKGANLAIPSRVAEQERGSTGAIPARDRPRNLHNAVKIGNRIYKFQGRGKDRKLVFMYLLKPSVQIKADVPFRQDFAANMKKAAIDYFVPRLAQAMRTRR